MSRSRLRLASSSGAWRTSSRSCLTIEPMRRTLAGLLDPLRACRRRRRSRSVPSEDGFGLVDHLRAERRRCRFGRVVGGGRRSLTMLLPAKATRGTYISSVVSEPWRRLQAALAGVGRVDEGDGGVGNKGDIAQPVGEGVGREARRTSPRRRRWSRLEHPGGLAVALLGRRQRGRGRRRGGRAASGTGPRPRGARSRP